MCRVLAVFSPAADILLHYAVTRHGQACLVSRINIRNELVFSIMHIGMLHLNHHNINNNMMANFYEGYEGL